MHARGREGQRESEPKGDIRKERGRKRELFMEYQREKR